MVVATGSLIETDGEQDQIKFQILVDAFEMLGYDLVNLTEQDVEMVKTLALLEPMGSAFGIIGSPRAADVNIPPSFRKKLLLNQTPVIVTAAAFDPAEPVERVAELFGPRGDSRTVNILILTECSPAIVEAIAATGIVDCLVCPAETDEAELISRPNKRPLVVSVGRYGKHVGKLEIRADESAGGLNLSFAVVDVNESLAEHDGLAELYKDYQQFVEDAGLLERYSRYPLSDELKYVGSETCGSCHDYEYEKWSTKAHAHAYATLEQVGSQYDPECVVCHVVGMEYESGFVSEQKTSHLKNVGCENCHGPGSKHIAAEDPSTQPLGEPKSDCADCHTPEHSAEFDRPSYLKKIVHWKEPKPDGNVK
jgi:hypothetical protein